MGSLSENEIIEVVGGNRGSTGVFCFFVFAFLSTFMRQGKALVMSYGVPETHRGLNIRH